MTDWSDDPKFMQWAKHVRDEVIPKISDSEIFVTITPGTEVDLKFAVELGLAIMMNKPMLAIMRPGQVISPKLALVCEKVIEADVATVLGREKISQEIKDFCDSHPS